ncbi:hypothetical protein IV203_008653 [Nitzschia inconspicua]|uniref:Uncharacterized protein n=1 Tax=Nitzschia inconspicua TaxID=303405 RepID=A0A9K3L0J1_9STRA|nr:hypothetical protein IV203_008653 [Nitzschia inconspicua]
MILTKCSGIFDSACSEGRPFRMDFPPVFPLLTSPAPLTSVSCSPSSSTGSIDCFSTGVPTIAKESKVETIMRFRSSFVQSVNRFNDFLGNSCLDEDPASQAGFTSSSSLLGVVVRFSLFRFLLANNFRAAVAVVLVDLLPASVMSFVDLPFLFVSPSLGDGVIGWNINLLLGLRRREGLDSEVLFLVTGTFESNFASPPPKAAEATPLSLLYAVLVRTMASP